MAKQRSAQQARREQQQKQKTDAKQRKFILAGLVAIAVVALVALIAYRTLTAPAVDDIDGVAAANIAGPIDAPIKIVEFGDFGCPSCRQWHNLGIQERLQAEFGDQINFTFRHFPVITAQSPRAAAAGQCAAAQDAFWPYHDYVYEQTPQNALSDADLQQYAAAIGLDTAAFNSCLEAGEFAEYVSQDWQAATAAGARGTPTFFINGRQVNPTYETMAAVIKSLLPASDS